MESKFYLARIYCLNVRPLYELFCNCAGCIARRIQAGKPVSVEVLAGSSMLKNLARELNRYSLKFDGVRCVEPGDFQDLARFVIDEAKED